MDKSTGTSGLTPVGIPDQADATTHVLTSPATSAEADAILAVRLEEAKPSNDEESIPAPNLSNAASRRSNQADTQPPITLRSTIDPYHGSPEPSPPIQPTHLTSSSSNVAFSSGAQSLAEIVSALWSLYEHEEIEGELVVTQAAYTSMYIRLAGVLYQRVDDHEALRSAKTDWLRDTQESQGKMNLATYTRSILEVAKQWTQDADWSVQAKFLQKVYHKMTEITAASASAHPKQKSSQLDKFQELWKNKYGTQRNGGHTSKQTCTDTEKYTRDRLARRRARRADADARVNTRGAKVYSHTADHEENMTLKSLNASGASNAVTLYTPWQPSWDGATAAALPHSYAALLPPQIEPVYTMRSRVDTERAIAKQQREHMFEAEWKAAISTRPQSAREHITTAVGAKAQGSASTSRSRNADTEPMVEGKETAATGMIGASSVPPHASATGTTHLSFIPFSTPTFPISANSSTTTKDRSQPTAPHLHPQLQPTPPVPARVRPHSAAATRMKHVNAHRKLVRELTSTHETCAELFTRLLPKDEEERSRIGGALLAVAFPANPGSRGSANKQATQEVQADLIPANVPVRPVLQEDTGAIMDAYGDETRLIRHTAAGHVDKPGFKIRAELHRMRSSAADVNSDAAPARSRPRSAIAANQLNRSRPLVLAPSVHTDSATGDTTIHASRNRPLLLMSGHQATTPYVTSLSTSDGKLAHEEEKQQGAHSTARPMSAHLVQTLEYLNQASRSTSRRPLSAMNGSNRMSSYGETPGVVYHEEEMLQKQHQHVQPSTMQHKDAENLPSRSLESSFIRLTESYSGMRTTVDGECHIPITDNTFLTSLANPSEEGLEIAHLSGSNVVPVPSHAPTDFSDFVMPTRVQREANAVVDPSAPEVEDGTKSSFTADGKPSSNLQEQRLILRETPSSGPQHTEPDGVFSGDDSHTQVETLLPCVSSPSNSAASPVALDPSILQAHPSLGLACVTIPPRAPISWRTEVVRGLTLAERLSAVVQASDEKSTKSWAWFKQLVAGSPTDETLLQARSIIPQTAEANEREEVQRVRANELRRSIYNSRAPEAQWLMVRDEENSPTMPETRIQNQPKTDEEKEHDFLSLNDTFPPSNSSFASSPRSHPGVPALAFDSLPASQVPSRIVMPGSAELRAKRQQKQQQRFVKEMEGCAGATAAATAQSSAADTSTAAAAPDSFFLTDVRSRKPLLLGRSSTGVVDFPTSAGSPLWSSSYVTSEWVTPTSASEILVKRKAGDSIIREELTAYTTRDARLRATSQPKKRPSQLPGRQPGDLLPRPPMKSRPHTTRPSSAAAATSIPIQASPTNDPSHLYAHRYHSHNWVRGYQTPPNVDFASVPSVVSAPNSNVQSDGVPVISAVPLVFPAPLSVMRVVSTLTHDPTTETSPSWWSRRGSTQARGFGKVQRQKGMIKRPTHREENTVENRRVGEQLQQQQKSTQLGIDATPSIVPQVYSRTHADGAAELCRSDPSSSPCLPQHAELYDSDDMTSNRSRHDSSESRGGSSNTSATALTSAEIAPPSSRPTSAYSFSSSTSRAQARMGKNKGVRVRATSASSTVSGVRGAQQRNSSINRFENAIATQTVKMPAGALRIHDERDDGDVDSECIDGAAAETPHFLANPSMSVTAQHCCRSSANHRHFQSMSSTLKLNRPRISAPPPPPDGVVAVPEAEARSSTQNSSATIPRVSPSPSTRFSVGNSGVPTPTAAPAGHRADSHSDLGAWSTAEDPTNDDFGSILNSIDATRYSHLTHATGQRRAQVHIPTVPKTATPEDFLTV